MPPLADLARDGVGVVALAGLLATAHRHPRPPTEALISVVAAAAVVASGLLGLDAAWDAVRPLLPVVGFLVAILVVSEVCARAGLFEAAAHRVQDHSRGRPGRLLLGVFVLAAIVTTVLSLDATVVLLTPVVVHAARRVGTSPRPGAYACLRLANSGSLLLPVSNLTNLLAMPSLGLTFAGFAARMALPLVVVLLIEYAGLRLLLRTDLATATDPEPEAGEPPRAEPVPLATVVAMLVAFAALSPLGVEPVWPAAVAAVVLLAWARTRHLVDAPGAVRAAHPAFAVFVLALGIVVAGLARGFLGTVTAHLLPGGTGFVDLLAIAAVATLAAALLANLSATLLLVPLLSGTAPILAALLGLTIGAGLTWTGSLANLLWRRTLARQDITPSSRTFHRVSLVLTPVALVGATAALALVT